MMMDQSFETLFEDEFPGDDCNVVAFNIGLVLDDIEREYKEGERKNAIGRMTQLALANCRHFLSDEHWCYFDDMYSPEYCYDGMLRLIAKDIRDGSFPDDLHSYLMECLDEISRTKCVSEYGVLDLKERLERTDPP